MSRLSAADDKRRWLGALRNWVCGGKVSTFPVSLIASLSFKRFEYEFGLWRSESADDIPYHFCRRMVFWYCALRAAKSGRAMLAGKQASLLKALETRMEEARRHYSEQKPHRRSVEKAVCPAGRPRGRPPKDAPKWELSMLDDKVILSSFESDLSESTVKRRRRLCR